MTPWHKLFFLFVRLFLTQQPPVGQSLFIHEDSRSHTTTHHCCIRQRKRCWSDVSQILSGQDVDPASFLRRCEGQAMAMKWNFNTLSLIVFT